MNFLDYVEQTIKNSNQKFFTIDQIIKLCGMKVGFDKRAVIGAVSELEKQDKLVKSSRNKYTLPKNAGAIKGTVVANPKGFVFVKPENDEVDDIFVAAKDVGGAVHGDTVLVRIISKPKSKNRKKGDEKSKSGQIIKILKRNVVNVVGTFSSNMGANIVVPDDTRFADSIFIPVGKTMNALSNNKVLVKITDYPSSVSMAKGEIIEILGEAGDNKVETLSVIRSFGLFEEFPKSVISEAQKVAKPISKNDLENRTDFRNQLVITIDGEDAKDFDDAISLTAKEDKFELSVHIADVSHYVKEDGEIDKQAFLRGTSVYFPDLVLPMLPEALSNNICSLRPNEDRLTLSVVMLIDSKGNVLNYKITKGVIRSVFRMTYTQVTKIFGGDKVEIEKCKKVVPMLEQMRILSKILIKRRNKAGNIDFDLPETQIDVDENGKTINIRRKPREDSDKLIEQFMVITNEVVARHFDKLKLPFVYRVHESPSQEKLASFEAFASGIGLKFNANFETVTPKDFQQLLEKTKGEPYFNALSKVMLRSMQKALYYQKDLGHFGLALKNYCHFTSPIRRYPDLMIHRIISYYLAGQLSQQKIEELKKKVELASERASETERNADEAERAVDDLKKAEFMANKVGEVYEGTVSGASEPGIFVELDNTVEGLVLREYLPADSYVYDQTRLALVGKNHTFKIGDRVTVRLVSVDVLTRHIDFALETNEQNNAKKRKTR